MILLMDGIKARRYDASRMDAVSESVDTVVSACHQRSVKKFEKRGESEREQSNKCHEVNADWLHQSFYVGE